MSTGARWAIYIYASAALVAAFLGWLADASLAEFFILYTLHCILFRMIAKEPT